MSTSVNHLFCYDNNSYLISSDYNLHIVSQPFVRALVWAVLVGSALHPAKTLLVSVAKKWLDGVSQSSSSLSVSALLLPLHTLDALSEVIGR